MGVGEHPACVGIMSSHCTVERQQDAIGWVSADIGLVSASRQATEVRERDTIGWVSAPGGNRACVKILTVG